jgi:hypothetical protein
MQKLGFAAHSRNVHDPKSICDQTVKAGRRRI